MGSGDDETIRTQYDRHLIGRMFRDLNQNKTNVKLFETVREMTNRPDDKSPSRETAGWKFDNNLISPHNKTSPNSNLNYKNTFFTDDSCSNDFFYDEEFTIPFDANLTDQRDSDEAFTPRHHRLGIAASKSDNCLHLGDVDADHQESDDEASASEREMFSSSDSSGLFNQPLFSSHSECPDEFALEASEDQDSVIGEEFPKDVHKSNHIKYHYKISFDRGPLKVWSSSDEPQSKTSLELRPSKAVHKTTSLGSQQGGEKVTFPSANHQKTGVTVRKSKKKSSQKNNATWNSKSSHMVTWGTLKNAQPGLEGAKSRTTWKEINKNSPSKEEPENVQNNAIISVERTGAKSCHEMNFSRGLEENKNFYGGDKELKNLQAGIKPSVTEKPCELFKIFQDKKMKEVEECIDDGQNAMKNIYDTFCLHDDELPSIEDDKSTTTKSNFSDLQGTFENAKKPRMERRLKFKSHSVDPNNSSPMNDSVKSPKIFQSTNVASTNSTDSSVQTSLIISIPVKTENKSLQTSLTLSEEKAETSGKDIWNTSSYLFSRPLPDLSFLKNSTKFLEPKAEEMSIEKLHKVISKEETKGGKKSNSQNQNKSNFKQTFAKSKTQNSPKTSQDSSGRSKSSSSFSFHSSSSSGIDPGTSDSGRQSSSGSSKDESLHSDTKDLAKTPPKPPRLFKVNQPGDGSTRNIKEEVDIKAIEACKEQSSKSLPEPRNAKNMARVNNGSLIRRLPSSNQDKSDLAGKGSKVVMRNNNHAGHVQPTKSILVRSRSKEGRRSWTNNLTTGKGQPNAIGEHATSPRKRPLSVPDGTLMELTTPTQGEEKPSADNSSTPPMTLVKDDTTPMDVTCDISKSHPREDGTSSSGGPITSCDQDYEKFRAKKSVSFSETISYHPTTSSLSPLESPKSPINSLPPSPDIDIMSQDPQKECSSDSAQENAEDVELPPNDFLVSPNISPATSLSDSSSVLHHLNFDLQQKKDLAMDVKKAVEVIFKHINRSKDPLAKAKLCSTVDNPKIGNLLLEHLCPSIHAIVLDGIKPNTPGLFGKVKSSACKVFEDSLEGSPFDSLNHLMKSMKDLKFLSNPWLKFNAYLFALLNLKVLDMWLASLRRNRPVLSRYYTPTSFLQLGSSGSTGSNTACQALFLDIVACLQPLSSIQFRLEYDFEVNIVERKRQAFIAEQLLNKHISCSSEVQAETESYLSRMYDAFSLDSSPPSKVQQGKHAASSLYCDNKSHESKANLTADESSEPSIFLLWSSVDFGGLARGLLQKTQNKLIEKLSQSRDMFSFDSVNNGSNKTCKNQNENSMSESSTNQKQAHPFLSFDSFVPPAQRPSSNMVHSDCSRSYPSNAAPHRPTSNLRGTVDASGTCMPGEGKTVVPCQASCNRKADDVSSFSQSETPVVQSSVSEKSAVTRKPISIVAHTRASPSSSPKNGTPPILASPATVQKSKVGLLSSYGNKLVDVFDKLLLNNSEDKNEFPFVIKKKYYSEDQISRHISDSPKNGVVMAKQSEQPILAKSVSCETEDKRIVCKPCKGPSSLLVSSHASGQRFARSLCHYVAMNGQFLSFEKDARMAIVKEVGHDFLLCRLNDQEGLVYKVCVSVV